MSLELQKFPSWIANIEEVNNSIKHSFPMCTVQGEGFFYFSFGPHVSEYESRRVFKDKNIQIYTIYNHKETLMGYFVFYKYKKAKPFTIANELGVSILYSKKSRIEYDKLPENIFSDKKIRTFCFGESDYFISVKWKSNNIEEKNNV